MSIIIWGWWILYRFHCSLLSLSYCNYAEPMVAYWIPLKYVWQPSQRLGCRDTGYISVAQCKRGFTHLLTHWSYASCCMITQIGLWFKGCNRLIPKHRLCDMWKMHPITFYRTVFLESAQFLGWMPLFVFFGLPIVSCSLMIIVW